MGGDRFSIHPSSFEEESSLDQEFSKQTVDSPTLSEGVLPRKLEKDSVNGGDNLVLDEFGEMGFCNSSTSLAFEVDCRRMRMVYAEVLSTYDDLQARSENLEEAKRKILSYTPGSWIEEGGGFTVGDYVVPETTSLLLIGPKGSGKSSLVNKISRFFKHDKFASERAQVSNSSSFGEGTYFLHEYMISRSPRSFCLYDTRSLSDDPVENTRMLRQWLTKGVRHGELVVRASDDANLKSLLELKARQCGRRSGRVRGVNFVIIVVNGISVLESMDSDDEEKKRYNQMVETIFRCPLLSFRDDKPVIAVTHGDLLTLNDRVRVRVYLGELLGISPKSQIFDIPESNDPATELAIVDLLSHCLEHADRNLPLKSWLMGKIDILHLSAWMLLFMVVVVGYIMTIMQGGYVQNNPPDSAPSDVHINWHEIRHLWLE